MTGVERIVVGVDGSDTSRAALRWVAPGLGAELDVVRAYRYPPALQDWTAVPSNYGFLPELPRSGHGGFSEMLRLGSVARACIEHAPCPVVVVPAS
jgi:nucleotide-binding universal stress UspA family protein